MARNFYRVALNHERDAAIHRKSVEFQEVPGEAEAEAISEAFIARAAGAHGGLGEALSAADGETRAHILKRLQREQGNAYVRRALSDPAGTPGRLVGYSQQKMVEEVARRKGPGSPLPEGTRAEMEGFFGADLGDVRLHADREAATLSRELHAQAFTVGSDIFFAEGRYDAGSTAGRQLLAHELTHVGQQGRFGAASTPPGVKAETVQTQEEEEKVQAQEEEEEEEQVQAQEEEEEVQMRQAEESEVGEQSL